LPADLLLGVFVRLGFVIGWCLAELVAAASPELGYRVYCRWLKATLGHRGERALQTLQLLWFSGALTRRRQRLQLLLLEPIFLLLMLVRQGLRQRRYSLARGAAILGVDLRFPNLQLGLKSGVELHKVVDWLQLLEPDAREHRPLWFSRLHQVLDWYVTPPDRYHVLRDKLEFERFCRVAGLPCIPTLGSARDGQIEWVGSPPRADDLFIKPRFGIQGRGAFAAIRDSDGAFRVGADRLSFEEVVHRIRELSRTEPLIIQPLRRNHAVIREVSPAALSTIRVMTVRSRSEDPRVIVAVIRMGVGTTVTDNDSTGGLSAAVAPETGEIGVASNALGPRREHPDTGARIQGRRLPHWDEVTRLVSSGHRALPHLFVIGWDIAILPEGACIVEANPSCGFLISQRRRPLGQTPFLPLLLSEAERLGAVELRRRARAAVGTAAVQL
jgi:hypothetical protein